MARREHPEMIGTILTALAVYAAIGFGIAVTLLGVLGRQSIQDCIAEVEPAEADKSETYTLTIIAYIGVMMVIWPSTMWRAMKKLTP